MDKYNCSPIPGITALSYDCHKNNFINPRDPDYMAQVKLPSGFTDAMSFNNECSYKERPCSTPILGDDNTDTNISNSNNNQKIDDNIFDTQILQSDTWDTARCSISQTGYTSMRSVQNNVEHTTSQLSFGRHTQLLIDRPRSGFSQAKLISLVRAQKNVEYTTSQPSANYTTSFDYQSTFNSRPSFNSQTFNSKTSIHDSPRRKGISKTGLKSRRKAPKKVEHTSKSPNSISIEGENDFMKSDVFKAGYIVLNMRKKRAWKRRANVSKKKN